MFRENFPDAPPGDSFTLALESCRQFLLSLANSTIPGELVPKGGASDLVQETLVKGYAARNQFQGKTLRDLRNWLQAILRNEMATFSRRFHGPSRDVTREIPAVESTLQEDPEALEQLALRERTECVTVAVGRLPKDSRQVLVLRFEQRLSFREIGERLGRSEEATRKLFMRTLDQLRGSIRNQDL